MRWGSAPGKGCSGGRRPLRRDDGYIILGKWSEGFITGKGKYVFCKPEFPRQLDESSKAATIRCYEGGFKNDRMHGEGELI